MVVNRHISILSVASPSIHRQCALLVRALRSLCDCPAGHLAFRVMKNLSMMQLEHVQRDFTGTSFSIARFGFKFMCRIADIRADQAQL